MFTDDNKKEFDREINKLLDEHGIKRTHRWQDYERAKGLLPVMAWYKYERALQTICKRVGL